MTTRKIATLSALGFFIFMLVVAYWADTDTTPALLRRVNDIPRGDLLGHMVLYGILAYLLMMAFPTRRAALGPVSVPLGVALALTFALLEELSQFFFATRTPDLLDLAAGALGIYLATRIPCARQCEK